LYETGPSAVIGAPSDGGYTKIYSTYTAFAALKADGSITAWGDSYFGGTTPSVIKKIIHLNPQTTSSLF
jgi:hypothetical protein